MIDLNWAPLPGYVGYYEITNTGEIRSVDRIVTCNNGRKLPYKSKIISQHIDKCGYKQVRLCNESGRDGRKSFNVHRLVAITFIKNPDDLPCVNHKNGIKYDNKIENLEWCTHSHNIKHAYDSGLINIKSGAAHKNFKYAVQASHIDKKSVGLVVFGNIQMKDAGLNQGCIQLCLNGIRSKHKGYTFTRIEKQFFINRGQKNERTKRSNIYFN